MLVRCVLMSCSGRVRQSGNVSLCIIRTVSDHLALHAHACVMRMHGSTYSLSRWLALVHLEERIHLGGRTQYAIRSHIVWLVDVGAGSYPEAAHALSTPHNSNSALAFQR